MTRSALIQLTFASTLMAIATACEQPRSDVAGAAGSPLSAGNDSATPLRTTPAEAMARIAGARCTRAAACNRIGPGKEFVDANTCRTTVQARLRDELGSQECTAGIDQDELNECLDEIRNEDCGNPLDQLGRLVACRTSDMCMH